MFLINWTISVNIKKTKTELLENTALFFLFPSNQVKNSSLMAERQILKNNPLPTFRALSLVSLLPLWHRSELNLQTFIFSTLPVSATNAALNFPSQD